MEDYGSTRGGATLKAYMKWDLEECMIQLVHMIIVDEPPFRHVEGKGFQNYCKYLVKYSFLPHNEERYFESIRRFRKIVDDERIGWLKSLPYHRHMNISLKFNYMCLTAHYTHCD